MDALISLDHDWMCDYFEVNPDLFEFAVSETVPSLPAWIFDRRRSEGWAALLHRTFTLEPTDFCVRYSLLIDSAPQQCRIYANNRLLAVYAVDDDDPPLELDITEVVHLGANTLEFRVEQNLNTPFSGIALHMVPCDD